MFKTIKIGLEKAILRDLDDIVKKMQELSDKGYSGWSVSGQDLIRFAIASIFGLAYPYISISKKTVTRAVKKIKKCRGTIRG